MNSREDSQKKNWGKGFKGKPQGRVIRENNARKLYKKTADKVHKR